MQVSGDIPVFVHEIPAGDPTGVQVDSVVRSYVVPPEVPCAIKVALGLVVPAFVASQTRGLEPLEQVDKSEKHTSKPLTLPRYAVAVAFALRPCAEAVIVDVPLPTPSAVALPHDCAFAQAPVISTIVEGLLVQETPLVICDLELSL